MAAIFVCDVYVTFVMSDNSKSDFISGKIQHVDFAVPALFMVSPIAYNHLLCGAMLRFKILQIRPAIRSA